MNESLKIKLNIDSLKAIINPLPYQLKKINYLFLRLFRKKKNLFSLLFDYNYKTNIKKKNRIPLL